MKSAILKYILVTFCLVLFQSNATAEDEIYTMQRLKSEGWSISKPMSAIEAEEKSLKEIKKAKKRIPELPLVPFGYEQEKWLGFKALLKKGEKIILISSPESDWKQLRGSKGYAIIRNEKVAYYFRTLVN